MFDKIGACTWIFGQTPLAKVAEGLAQLGYNGVELLGDRERYPVKETRQILEGEGLSVFSLTPPDIDLAHSSPGIRRQALDEYLRLLDYSKELGAKIVSCHGKVGRVRSLTSQDEELKLFKENLAVIAEKATKLNLLVALETLNRYESNLLNTADEAIKTIEELNFSCLGILLDTYHMNIEEADFIAAIQKAGKYLFLFHLADSNRRAIGRGHIPFSAIFSALKEIAYQGPLIVECNAPGPDPFSPEKGPGWETLLWDEIKETINWLRQKSLTRYPPDPLKS